MTASKFAEPGLPLVTDPPARSLRLAREFARYFACSALALAVDAGLFGAGLRLGLAYPVAAAIGFIAGLAVAYTLSVRVVFRERRLKDARAEFVVFSCIGLGGLVITEILLWALMGQAAWHPASAKLVTAGFVFCFNFGARKVLLFTLPRSVQ